MPEDVSFAMSSSSFIMRRCVAIAMLWVAGMSAGRGGLGDGRWREKVVSNMDRTGANQELWVRGKLELFSATGMYRYLSEVVY